MKKFLLTVALILAVVTSLTAGTLAAYNQTLSLTGDVVNTKSFNFTASGSTQFDTATLEMAPGDEIWYRIDVENDSEVDTNFVVSSEATGDLVTTGAVVMTVYESDRTTELGASFNKDRVADKGAFEFYVKLSWAYSTDPNDIIRDNALEDNGTAQLAITVNGTSANEANTNAGTVQSNGRQVAFHGDTLMGHPNTSVFIR